jgi:hypothetical protein
LDHDAVILEYRIGKAAGATTTFTYYEANYQMPDNTLRVTHASGPIPLISHRRGTLAASFLGCTLLAIGFSLASSWGKLSPGT